MWWLDLEDDEMVYMYLQINENSTTKLSEMIFQRKCSNVKININNICNLINALSEWFN
jgi:hypothetical protein